MAVSGLILDVYDDVDKTVAKSIYSDRSAIPMMVKAAHVISSEEITKLPDDAFALVAYDDNGKSFRKFACVDPGNTMLSVEYFCKTAHKLSKQAQVETARNLVTACGMYGIPVPDVLVSYTR